MSHKILCQLPVAQTPAVLEEAIKTPFTVDPNRGVSDQVHEYLLGLGDPRGITHLAVVGQAAPAIVTIATLQLLGGLPEIAVMPPSTPPVFHGWFDSDVFRQEVVRPHRADFPQGEASGRWFILDGGGRLSQTQKAGIIDRLDGATEENVVVIAAGGASTVDFAGLVGGKGVDAVRILNLLVDALLAAEVTSGDLTAGRVVLAPPGNALAAIVAALVLNGLSERWPLTVRYGGPAVQFGVTEIVNPELEREWAKATEATLVAAEPRAALSGNIPEAFRAALLTLAAEHGVQILG